MVAHHITDDTSGIPYFKAIRDTSKLVQNPQGYFQIRYSIPTESGWRSKTISTRTSDYSTAQSELTQWLNRAQEQIDASARPHDPTIEELFNAYLDAKNLSPRDSLRYTAKSLCAVIGHLRPRDVTDSVIADYITTRRCLKNGKLGLALKPGSHRRALGAMKTAILWGVRRKMVDANDVPVFDMPAESPPRLKYMTHEQEAIFWNAAQRYGGQVGLFVALGLETAARKNAIFGLTWDRVDWANRQIDLQDPAKRITRKRNAVVPISDRLMPVLKTAHEAVGYPKRGRLFGVKVRRAYEYMAANAGLGWVTPHVMRHTWASLAAIDGVPLFHIAKMLGDTIATVEKTYAKVAPSDLMSVVNRPKRGT